MTWTMRSSKVALVGTCPSSRLLALRLPPDWQIWTLSPGNMDLPRIDLWFELHGDLDAEWERQRLGDYVAWLNAQTFPVFAQDRRLIHRAMIFPVETMLREFSAWFFTSMPAWMMAFAIMNKATEIGLFGMDMAARSEYGYQKPAMLHLAWLAEQRGIKLLVPPESEALQAPPLYGYSYNSPMGHKLRTRQLEIEASVREMDRQIDELASKRRHFLGCLDENDWAQQTWTGGLWRPQGGAQVVRLKEVDRDGGGNGGDAANEEGA